MSVLVVAEHDNNALKASTLHCVTAAALISTEVVVLVAGYQCEVVAEQVAAINNVVKVLHADQECYQHPLAENLAELVVALVNEYSVTHLLAPATTFGKNLLPRAAALLDVNQISDIVKVISDDTFMRPIYAGNAFLSLQSSDPIKVITVRSTAFESSDINGDKSPILLIDKVFDNQLSRFVELQCSESSRPELTSARIVISGGRGLKNAENFHLLEKIADRLGAAIGASRAAVDAGFVPNDYQVGQTGKVVAPDLYIAVGISGAIQHVAGIKDSKVIVAINKDEDAPIFNVADYGLVADLFEALPELDMELEKLGY